MNNRTALFSFFILVVVFVFSFVFGLDALAKGNVTYGVLSLIGFIVSLAGSLLIGSFCRTGGESLSVWFYTYAVVVSILFVWFLTRCGTAFHFWT